MRLFGRECSSAERLTAAVAGELSAREWFDVETHASTCAQCADALRDAVAVDVALTRAFAPLRSRRTMLAPGRVRMALGPSPEERQPRWLRVPALFARLAEVSVAVGVVLFAVTGSVEPPSQTVAPQPRSVIHEYFRTRPPTEDIDYFRWLRLQPAARADVAADLVRLPVGGRFDVEQVETVINPSSTPR
jgi:anti-sigma factor RsiW